MHGSSERRNEGLAGHDGASRPPARPLAALEAYALCFIILAALGVGNLTLYFKLDAFQHATISLVESLDESRIKQNAIYAQSQRMVLTDILNQVKAAQAKTDAVAAQTLEISQQTAKVGHQNSDVLEQLREITTSHTRDIKAAKAAAQKAQAQSRVTEKTIATPWYKKVFK